ncbi:hypothetical protein KR009_001715, partial [Drosophila setifemur]
DAWNNDINKKYLPGDRTTAQLGSLKPAQAYHIRLYAENHLGISAPSDELFLIMDSEAPSAPPQDVTAEPLGPQQLFMTWRAPPRDTWNGDLLGYTITYTKYSTSNAVRNHTRVNSLQADGLNDFRLIGLDKYMQYEITISAYNRKGEGPPSEVALAHTLEDVPSVSPQSVSCLALTAQNIQVSWQSPPKEMCHGVIQGFKLFYEPINLENEYNARETKITSALSTVLHGLQPFTNYSVEILAFTRAGEGTLSLSVSCITEEAVPDAPERVKSIVSSESSVIISWLSPRRRNGIITKYNVYIRVLEKSQEIKILKEVLAAHNRHFEAKDLNLKETYEAWVTASTKVGQGPSTPVIKLAPHKLIPAAIISFSQTLSVSWKTDINLACIFVGNPKAAAEWNILSTRSKTKMQVEVNSDNSLSLLNIDRSNQGNYSCTVRNNIGSDYITYLLIVQVPPSTPIVSITSIQKNSISIQWRVDDIGGAPLCGFTLTFRKESEEWEKLALDRRKNTYFLKNLQCGTQYQITINTFNRIGTSLSGQLNSIKTKGNKPIAPPKQSLVRLNITSISLDLSSWQDGGCPISHFSIEFKLDGPSTEWIIVSNKIESNAWYIIGDLDQGTSYHLRITAHNNAGSTDKEIFFTTLTTVGVISEIYPKELPTVKTIFSDSHLIAVIVTSVFGTILALVGALICLKNYPLQSISNNIDTIRTNNSAEERSIQHQDHFYGTVRKACRTDTGSELGHGRIPECSEDIYPYATFNLPDHENESDNIPLGHNGKLSSIADDIILCSVKCSAMSNANDNKSTGMLKCMIIEKESVRCSKLKSESEEYDSLNSDSELSSERTPDESLFLREQSTGEDGNTG